MRKSNRLKEGGFIDRDQPITFIFNRKKYQGYQGDTLASALLAEGIRIFGRSFKYHRPRGLLGSGSEEPNALVQIGTPDNSTPNLKATQVEIYEGLEAKTVAGWPSLDFDIGKINNFLSRFLPAGFYYKTFMWPKSGWMFYEHQIRKIAGLGYSPTTRDKARYDKRNTFPDVLVVGGGPCGLLSALNACRSGARVLLVDEQSKLGGALLSSDHNIDGKPGLEWISEIESELMQADNVTVLNRTTLTGYYDHNFLIANEKRTDHESLDNLSNNYSRERLWRIRAKQVILATGAIERPIAFVDNDVPGVMLCSAVSCYIRRYAVRPGVHGVVFTNNDSGYQTAIDMLSAGMRVAGVVDIRGRVSNKVEKLCSDNNIEIFLEHAVISTKSNHRGLKSVELGRLATDLNDILCHKGFLKCDVLAVSGGWSPAVHLHSQSGGKLKFNKAQQCFVPWSANQQVISVGACNGVFDNQDCLISSVDQSSQCLRDLGFSQPEMVMPGSSHTLSSDVTPCWNVPAGRLTKARSKKFLDFQNDTTVSDIQLAVREGYTSVEHMKRFTLLGFGTDQGKTGNINGLGVLSEALSMPICDIGTTTFRPNYTPVTFGAVAGRSLGSKFFDPVRKTAIHNWHLTNRAEFENVGQWKRPWYYPRIGESMRDAVKRECFKTRTSVGIMDASTLGKIDIQGPDCIEFLNWVYTNDWDNLKNGRCRYGIMLSEDGMIMDDGVTTKIGDNHYIMTTTTGGAASVLAWLERWLQTEWPHLRVHLTSVSEHWSIFSLAGPKSREVLNKVGCDINLDKKSFSFMSSKTGKIDNIPVRLSRISFSGELGFEIMANSNYALHLWNLLIEKGGPFGITPYGTEAMHVLRAEKGYLIVGQDTDGSVTPYDMGLGWLVSKNKDFLGKRSLSRSDTNRNNRKEFVGIKTVDPTIILPEGAQLVSTSQQQIPIKMIGHVTSSYYSNATRSSIALALVKDGQKKLGERIYAHLIDGSIIPCTICDSVFYDKDNLCQRR